MTTDNNRAAFEALYLAGSKNRLPVERMQDDGYRFMPVQKAWEAWQTSRKQAIEEAAALALQRSDAYAHKSPDIELALSNYADAIKELMK